MPRLCLYLKRFTGKRVRKWELSPDCFGLIAGVIAKLLPARWRGFILTCILGIVSGSRWRMAGDDVWYWRKSIMGFNLHSFRRRGGRDRGAGDFPPSATRLTAAKRLSVDPVSAVNHYKHALLRRCRDGVFVGVALTPDE